MTFSLRQLLTGLFLGTCTALNFGYLSVQTTQVCMDQTLLSTPPGPDTIYVDSIAWPIGSAIMPEPLIVNDQMPTSVTPQILCMGGCVNPPCWPVSSCSPPDLFWAARFANLSVPPNFFMRLPDMPVGTTPPMLMVLFDTVGPSPTPAPSVSVTPSPSPSVSASVTVSPSPSVTGRPSQAVVPLPTQTTESPHATPAAIVFGLLFGAASVVIFGCWRQGLRPPCPYCEVRVTGGSAGMRSHLKTCRDHLALFQPFVVESVTAVSSQQLKQQDVVLHVIADEKEDLISRTEPPGMVPDEHRIHQGVKD